ncbi:hypothetical protein [Rhodopila sp.]|uniref:hypothetical protein n=1 Tax=Rhodopila sp. TaxID=2480087 RepID=UPI002D80F707|nr:hypothetical protein [Rhodopila sp.]
MALLRLLELPDALPADLALRLGADLIAAMDGPSAAARAAREKGFICEAVSGSAP